MIAKVYNRIESGTNVFYDACFFHVIDEETTQDSLSLGCIVFDINVTVVEIEERITEIFSGNFPEETLTEIIID